MFISSRKRIITSLEQIKNLIMCFLRYDKEELKQNVLNAQKLQNLLVLCVQNL